MAERFAQTYLAISDPVERLLALQRLVQTIEFGEAQAVCTFVHDRNDIIAHLPAELLLHVFSYLDIQDAWCLQLVNRAWRRMLSSDEFLRSTLARWDSHHPSDTARSPDSLRNDTVVDKVAHMQAIRRGVPSDLRTIDNVGSELGSLPPKTVQGMFAFKRNKIAYILHHSRQTDMVIVRHLVTGAATMLRGEALERIMSLTLTTDLVAFVTFDAWLYVADLTDNLFLRSTSKVRIPSSRIRAIAGHARTVVIAVGTGSVGSAFVTSILIYNLDTKHLQGYSVATAQKALEGTMDKMNTCALLVDSHRGTIDIFTLMANETKILRANLRVSFNGEPLSSHVWTHQGQDPLFSAFPASAHRTLAMFPPQPTGHRDEYRISIGRDSVGEHPLHVADVYFNTRTAAFAAPNRSFRYYKSPHPENTYPKSEPSSSMHHAYWKDLAIRPVTSRYGAWTPVVAMMNDSFLVALEVNQADKTKSRVNVFRFDEKVSLLGQ